LSLVISRLSEEDLSQDLVNTLRSDNPNLDLDAETMKTLFHRIDAEPNRIVLVAALDKKIVGAGSVILETKLKHKGTVARIDELVVGEEYRKQGIGKCLLVQLMKHAKNNDAVEIVLSCKGRNVAFFNSLGIDLDINTIQKLSIPDIIDIGVRIDNNEKLYNELTQLQNNFSTGELLQVYPVKVEKIDGDEQIIYKTEDLELDKLYPIEYNGEHWAVKRTKDNIEFLKFRPN